MVEYSYIIGNILEKILGIKVLQSHLGNTSKTFDIRFYGNPCDWTLFGLLASTHDVYKLKKNTHLTM